MNDFYGARLLINPNPTDMLSVLETLYIYDELLHMAWHGGFYFVM